MKNAVFSILLFLLLVFTSYVSAQTQGIAYPAVGKGVATTFVTDYHSLGINSSALGWGTGYENKHFTMGLTEFGMGIYSDSLSAGKLRNFYRSVKDQVVNGGSSTDYQQQRDAAADFAQSGVTMFVNYNWFGFSYQAKKFGGIAFNIQENYNWYSKLNEETTDILFRGKLSSYFDSLTVVYGSDTTRIANNTSISEDTLNHVVSGSFNTPLNLSQITKGSELRAVWNRYYNFGYGRKILGKDSVFVLYGGIGGRFIQSVAMFNMVSDDNGLYMFSSVSPMFNINYGSVATSNPSTVLSSGNWPKVVGSGYGIDLSASLILFNKLKIAAAVNNIGQVTYKRNVYKVNDTLVSAISVDGINDYNITRAINSFLQQGGLFTLQGQETYKVNNASTVRFGASLDLGKIAKIGIDVVAPFNKENPGSLVNAVYSAGGEIKPVKWIALSAGYIGGGVYKNNVPVGINFILKNGSYEFGISSYDALSFFMNDSNSISTAFGVARFRF